MGKGDIHCRLYISKQLDRHGKTPCIAKSFHDHTTNGDIQQNQSRKILDAQIYETTRAHQTQPRFVSKNNEEAVFSWNFIIKERLRNGQSQAALRLFEDMQQQGIMPDKITYVCISSACAAQVATVKGRQIHARVANMPLESDVTLVNALLNMHGKCDSLEMARCMFDKMVEKNVISWNTMIKLYKGDKALQLFDQMQNEGILPDTFTFTGTFSACASQAALIEGMRLHAQIVCSGFETNITIGNTIIHMYGKCNSLENAKRIFDAMPERNIVSWNAIITAYAQHGQGKEALQVFEHMQQKGIMPDKVSFLSMVSACTEGVALTDCEQLHDLVMARGFIDDISVMNALVKMYGKHGSLENARRTFKEMPERNTVSWNALIGAYAHHGQGKEALKLFNQMQQEAVLPDKFTLVSILSACGDMGILPKGEQLHSLIVATGFQSDLYAQNALMNMYGKCGNVNMARKMFDEILERDHITWNCMIASYAQQGHGLLALQLFHQMLSEAVLPDNVTFVSVLSACSCKAALTDCHAMHARIVGNRFHSDVFTGNALVNMYAKQGSLEDACGIFNEMHERDVVSWNALISAYAEYGQGNEAFRLFEQMLCEGELPTKITFVSVLSSIAHCADQAALAESEHMHARIVSISLESDMVVANALVNIYGKCGSLKDCRKVFDMMPNRSVISWNVIIAACVHVSQSKEAFYHFDRMRREVMPDKITFATILAACTDESDLAEGKRVHDDIVKFGFESDVVVGNALLNMYGKCGSLVDARNTFDIIPEQNLISWNSMITAYGQHGKGKEALDFFEKMKQGVVVPNVVTFINVLSACNHAGMVDEGCYYFVSMFRDHDIMPVVEHFDCMIDLLGRAGRLDEAEDLIKSMPFEPTQVSFISLLGASKHQIDVDRGERAADCISALNPNSTAPYVILSNIYAATG